MINKWILTANFWVLYKRTAIAWLLRIEKDRERFVIFCSDLEKQMNDQKGQRSFEMPSSLFDKNVNIFARKLLHFWGLKKP